MRFKGVYLWVALPVAVILVWILAFYLPISAEIRSSAQEIRAVKSEAERTENDIASTSALIQRDRQIQQSFTDFSTQVPHVAALPDFIRWVTKRAKETGLSVSQMNSTLPPSTGVAGAAFLHPLVEVDVRGRFLQMGRFLDDLSQKYAFNSIVKAKVSYSERENPVLNAKYVVELNVWRDKPIATK